MRNNNWKKNFIFVIIFLIIGATFTTSIAGKTDRNDDEIYFSYESIRPSIHTDWWPMFRHDLTHSGFSTSVGPETNKIKWTYNTGEDIFSSPSVKNDKLYIGTLGSNYGNVYCLNVETGGELWSFPTGDWVVSSPSINNGRIYIGSTDDNMYCIDADSGDLVWNQTIPWIVSSPAVTENRLFIGSGDKNVYCLDPENGDILWNYTTDYLIESSPSVANGRVYIGSGQYNDGGRIYCLNELDGDLIWEKYIGGIVSSSPTIADDKIYVGYSDRQLGAGGISCMNTSDGEIIWDYPTNNSILWSSPAIFNNKVFIGSDDYNLYCLDSNLGDLIFTFTTDGSITSSPAIANEKIYFASTDKNIYCINTSGGLIWKYTTDDMVMSSPCVADGRVFIGSYDNKIYCFEDDDINQPPEPPNIYGPTTGKKGQNYAYTFQSIDPNGDEVYYYIDWGDDLIKDWFGPYPSKEKVVVSHSWSKKGEYTIKAKAKDVYGAESKWGTLEITMPKYKTAIVNYPMSKWLFKILPDAFLILNYMLS